MSIIDDHLQKLEAPQRQALEHLRQIIQATVPDAQEVTTYGMPGFKYRGKYLASFSAFRDHLSLFPGAWPADFAERLQPYKTSKGTIQFTVDNPLPDDLVRDIVTLRVAQIDHV